MTGGGLVFENERIQQDYEALLADSALAHVRMGKVDALLGGIRKSSLYIIGASPGTGKTTLVGQWADELAMDGHPVIFVNLEMPREQLVRKSISRFSGKAIPLSGIGGDAGGCASDLAKAMVWYKENVSSNIAYTDDPITPVDLSVYVSDVMRERERPPIVFVDYAQIMPPASSRMYTDERSIVKDTVAGLRHVANGHGCAVIAISSIRRTDYGKAVIGLDGLAEAQNLEYGADLVAYLSVPGKGVEQAQNLTKAVRPVTFSVVKNRYGELGSTNLVFDTRFASFEEA